MAYHNSVQRTGIETPDFLFDIFDYLVGVSKLNNIKICDSVLAFSNFD